MQLSNVEPRYVYRTIELSDILVADAGNTLEIDSLQLIQLGLVCHDADSIMPAL